ncbi:hypothetical protein HPB52_011123 [Rhipicephalus sanguineus]|uniref:Uncharacterized protein n=2 Tax=Rhipicephalus sanguineus TaxID=34632 RepID=A0A9D4T5U2_RHISA|nr:hypothetical protein HPB52_011123 [Rhipicephalus sanguineus]
MAELPYWGTEQHVCEFSCLKAQHEVIRVAVCDAVECCINGSSLCPPPLMTAMLQSFLDNIEKYIKVLGSNQNLTGMAMPFCQPGNVRGYYQFGVLVTRLRTLETEVRDLLKARNSEEE